MCRKIVFAVAAVILFLQACKKETAAIHPAPQSLKAIAAGSFVVHSSVRRLDLLQGNVYNYEFSFWVTRGNDTTTVLEIPEALLVTGTISAAGANIEKTIELPTGSYVTRRFIALPTPVSVTGKFTTPGMYLGRPIRCNSTVAEKPYNLLPIHVQGTGFADAAGKAFIPWGVNYTNTNQLRLVDDNWYEDSTWKIIKQDFREMKALDLNVIRIHLQYNRFMTDAFTPNQQALARLKDMIAFAGVYGLYLDITGLGCYIKEDTPDWYDAMSEADRWATQAVFWKAIANAAKGYNNIFAYNLMNEPVTPSKKTDTWLPGEPYGGYYFVQNLTRTPAGRSWETVTRTWIQQLKTAIREEDTRTPVTVGFIALGVITKFNDLLDYNSAHLYPEDGKMDEAMGFVTANQTAKPLIIEETNWFAGFDNMEDFITTTQNEHLTAGYLAHYHGETIPELEENGDLGSAIQLEWYKLFCYTLNPNFYIP